MGQLFSFAFSSYLIMDISQPQCTRFKGSVSLAKGEEKEEKRKLKGSKVVK